MLPTHLRQSVFSFLCVTCRNSHGCLLSPCTLTLCFATVFNPSSHGTCPILFVLWERTHRLLFLAQHTVSPLPKSLRETERPNRDGFCLSSPTGLCKRTVQLDQRSDIFKMSLCGSNGTDLNNRCRGAMNVAVKY